MTTKILVVIASYGAANDRFLSRVLSEYRSMPYDVDIVVLSNAHKNLPQDVELAVGLPTSNPWSLPFGHKKIFADRLHDYDLFIYSEDDILVTENNIKAFLWAAGVLNEDEIPGFILMEIGPDGSKNYPQAHGPFHWDVQSVKSVAGHTFASFTNKHTACYLITKDQLRRAVASGGFLVRPHEGRYDMLCSAATDPYTQCGLSQLTCISRLSDFELHHLPNKYVNIFGTSDSHTHKQIKALMGLNGNCGTYDLFPAQTKLMGCRLSKNYYEPTRKDVAGLISSRARSILSVGTGIGETEAWLASRGNRVVAVPMDAVISAGLEGQGVKVVKGDLKTVRDKLAGAHFDCLLMLSVLHLVPNPAELLCSLADLLTMDSQVVVTVPNLSKLSIALNRMRGDKRYLGMESYDKGGVQLTSRKIVNRWMSDAGLKVEKFAQVMPPSGGIAQRTLSRVRESLFSSEFIVSARRR